VRWCVFDLSRMASHLGTACGLYCHSRCAPFYHMQCNSAASFVPEDGSSTPSELFGNDLSRQVELENRQVPNIVSACIAAVEEYGMDFEGIYRKSALCLHLRVRL
jgi:hypothetical protein